MNIEIPKAVPIMIPTMAECKYLFCYKKINNKEIKGKYTIPIMAEVAPNPWANEIS